MRGSSPEDNPEPGGRLWGIARITFKPQMLLATLGSVDSCRMALAAQAAHLSQKITGAVLSLCYI